MELVNPQTAFRWTKPLNIHGVAMMGVPEKQGHAFSRHGFLAALDDPTLNADAIGRAVRRQLRPLSAPTLARARDEYTRKEVIKFPRYFIIEPINLCNRACPFCSIIVMERPFKGMMKWDTFAKLMDECAQHDVYGLSLYQLGEPFLWRATVGGVRRDISHMVNYAKRVGGFKAVNLSTNGDVDNLDCILGSDLDDLIISIDGITAEVYDANRPATNKREIDPFGSTIRCVREFLERKAASGQPRPWVRLQCINKENTAPQILDFIREWIAVPGVDDVLIKNLDSMRPWLGNSVVSDAEDAIKAERTVGQVCQHIYAVGSVVVEGSLTACCHDAKTELTDNSNINNVTFEEWWNGPFMTTLRQEHNSGHFRKPCEQCRERDTWLG